MYASISRFKSLALLLAGIFSFSSTTTAHAASATITTGQPATLAITVSGSAPFWYKWYKDGSVLTGAVNSTYAISSFQTANAGAYYAVVSNSAGSTTSDTASLTLAVVATAPAFTTQPASQTVTVGGTTTFTAAASGSPAPAYQWKFNGTAIAGATSASLTITNVQAANAGTYTAVATNLAGSATSTGVVLTVNAATVAPVITTQPINQTVTAGSSVTFTAAASGTPAPYYQWQKNGVNISGATGALYTIASATSTDAGTYRMVAANSAGSMTSSGAVLTINTVPAITTQPASQTVTAGGSVTFTAAASGAPAPAYQWRKNGTNIIGATSASYSLVNVSSGDAGTYTMAATNSAGSATSTGAALTVTTVNTAPTISNLADLSTPTGAAAGPISFTIGDAETAAASLTVSGSSSNSLLVPNANIVFGGSGATRTMTVTPAAGQTGTATITVTVSDGALTATDTFVLSVNPAAVTRSFSNTTAIAILDQSPASPYPAAITVTGMGGTISAVSVQLNGFHHTCASDTDVLLVSPTGQKVLLMSDAGYGTTAASTTLTFSDAATASLPQNGTLYAGTYKPTNYGTTADLFAAPAPAAPYQSALAAFNGLAANGTWSLYVIDAAHNDVGAIDGGWTLTVTTTGAGSAVPTISDIPDQSTTSGTATAAIPFTVNDPDTAASALTLSGSSSNTTLVPAANITFGGSGSSRTVTVAPVAGQTGTATISVTVGDGSTTMTDNFVLTVNPPLIAPTITTQPVSQTVTAGAAVTFTAAANGSPAPSYQWRFNGTNIIGATTATLSLTGVTAANAGTYTLVATNSVGTATSTGALLTVNSAPVFTTQPLGQTIATGTSVTFTAVANGLPTPSYQWNKNGAAIAGATATTYSITSATTGDAATYTVVATNSVGSTLSNAAVLVVTGAPVITKQPATQTVTRYSTVTFQVVATGAPTLTYQWRKNGSRIRGATDASYTISSASSTNAGTYTVTVTNSYGSVTSTGAVLAVKSATAPAVIRVDFNGDGRSDILWQNSVTGECTVWLMAGTSVSGSSVIGTFSTDWQANGTGDFNGDGQPDILWQNTVTGERAIWLMAGTSITSQVSLGTISTDWQMCGAGDFNGDGKSDILWQNTVTGERTIWLMAGTNVTKVVSLGVIDPVWQISGAGDFNMDGQSDLLLQNIATGEIRVWLMAGTSVGSVVSISTPAPEWQVSGSGDFNADGRSDILLQNVLTGECSMWLMSGASISSTVSLGTMSTDWVIRN